MAFSLRVGRVSGIPVYLHWSFFLAVPLLTLIIGYDLPISSSAIGFIFGVPVDLSLIQDGAYPYILGLATSLGFYACFFIYQLATVLVASRRGFPARDLTILIIGSFSSYRVRITRLRDVLPIALSGPVSELCLGLVALVGVYTAPGIINNPPLEGFATIFLGYLAIFNLALLIFNLLPGLPMNGGRILQAWMAERSSPDRATRISVIAGKTIAILFILLGVIFLNIIFIIVGILVYFGAGAEERTTPPA